jgi:hypothetical protein
MTKLIENDPVRTLFQDEELPARYDVTLAKILNDNLVLMRIQDELRRYFGAIAIARMSEGEIWTLKKRISLLLSAPGALDKPGAANIEIAQERIRRHNTGDHSQCTPETCAVKATPVPRPAESPAQVPYEEPVPPRLAPARPHIRWYVDCMQGVIVAEVPDDEKQWFSGKPEDASKFNFRGEKCPAYVVEEYARFKAA